MRLSIVVLMAAATTARGDSFKAGDYEISGDSVTKAKVTIPLIEKGLSADKVVVDAKAKRVAIDATPPCGVGVRHFKFTFDQLEARFANFEALKLHLAKKYKEAATGFERATKLDPSWNIAAYNLASARNVLKDETGALAALAPWVASEPLATYAHVLDDPELQSLATTKPFAALKSKKPGTATVTKNYVFAADRGLFGYTVARSSSWMACAVVSDLEIHDVKTGAVVANVPVITSSDLAGLDCQPPGEFSKSATKKFDERRAKRAVAIDKWLADGGFDNVTGETATMPREPDEQGKQKTAFPKSKLYAVVGKNGTNILRGNTVVGTVGGDQLVYFDTAKYMVGIDLNQNEGGCPNETYNSGPIK